MSYILNEDLIIWDIFPYKNLPDHPGHCDNCCCVDIKEKKRKKRKKKKKEKGNIDKIFIQYVI